MGQKTIASTTLSTELNTFLQDTQPDVLCGLSPMLAWNWSSDHNNSNTPFGDWGTTLPTSTNSTSLKIALSAITQTFPSKQSLMTTQSTGDLTNLIINTVSLFSFMMLYNQIASFRKENSLNNLNDPILAVCVAAISASTHASIIPSRTSTTKGDGNYSLDSTILAATRATVSYLNSTSVTLGYEYQDAVIPLLEYLIPHFFTPLWTLLHFASYADGRMPNTSFYDQRYAPLVIANAFSNWLKFINQHSPTDHTCGLVANWIDEQRKFISGMTESDSDIAGFFTSVKNQASNATNNVNALERTNHQFERRKGRVATLSENLQSTRAKSNIALAILSFWITACVASFVVAIFLFRKENYAMLNMLIVATLSLVLIDALARGVMSAMSTK